MRHRLGEGELALCRLQLRRFAPCTALQGQARGHCRLGIRPDEPRRRRRYAQRFFVGLARLAVAAELQAGVDDVVHRVQGVIAFLALQRHVRRSAVGAHRILPRPDPRKDVRRHMQRMRRVGRDAGVTPGRGHPFLRDRRGVIAVDQVVRHARMVRILRELLLEDRRRLEGIRVGLVRGLLDGDQVERIEDLRLVVLRILGGERLIGLGARKGALALVAVRIVFPVGRDRFEIVLLALRLGAHLAALVDRRLRACDIRRWRAADEGVVHQDRSEAPGRHHAIRILAGDFLERALPRRPPERMQHRDAARDLLLHLRAAGVGEVHLAELLARLAAVVVVRKGGDCEKCCDHCADFVHGTPPDDASSLRRDPVARRVLHSRSRHAAIPAWFQKVPL